MKNTFLQAARVQNIYRQQQAPKISVIRSEAQSYIIKTMNLTKNLEARKPRLSPLLEAQASLIIKSPEAQASDIIRSPGLSHNQKPESVEAQASIIIKSLEAYIIIPNPQS